MKAKKTELSHSQTNVDTQDKEKSTSISCNSVTYEKVKETPFAIVKNEKNKWIITMGKYVAHEEEFNSREEAIATIHNGDWKLITNTVFIIIQSIKDQQIL